MSLIEALPIPAETMILTLRIVGIIAILTAIALFARGMMLHNALSSARAHRMIHEQFHPKEQDDQRIVVQPVEEPPVQPEKPKKTLLVFTLTPEAQDFLGKISTKPIYEDGWNVTPAVET